MSYLETAAGNTQDGIERAGAASTLTSGQPRQERLGYIDGLRALAALFVVAHHVFNTVPGIAASRYNGWLNYGHFSVGVFITLSGYCLMLPAARQGGMLRDGALGFFQRRARRILPTYYAALGLSLLFILLLIHGKTGAEWDVSLPVTWRQVLAHALLLQDVYVKSGAIDYPCWSIAVEWQIYFLFPLLVFCWRKCGAYVATLTGIVAAVAVHHIIARKLPELLSACPWYLGLFTLGMFGAWVAAADDPGARSLRSRMPWKIVALVAFAGVVAICLRLGPQKVGLHVAVPDYLVGIATASLLVASSLERGKMLRAILGWPPLVAIGTFAYSIYLMHAPLAQIIWQYGVRKMHLNTGNQFLVMEFVGLPLVIALCYPFFLLFERPFLVKRKGETPRQVALDAARSPAP